MFTSVKHENGIHNKILCLGTRKCGRTFHNFTWVHGNQVLSREQDLDSTINFWLGE